MFDLLECKPTREAPARAREPSPPGRGADRYPVETTDFAPWLTALLDELDHGIVLIGADRETVHANDAALAELEAAHPLRLVQGGLRARHPDDGLRLEAALEVALRRGFRKQLAFDSDGQRVMVSVVPLTTSPNMSPRVLVMLGKRRSPDRLSLQAFATSCGLTATEAQVLAALSEGLSPAEVAARTGVAISTVRTHISNIRLKTGTRNIRTLLQEVASLPPMRSVLRQASERLAMPTERALM